MADELTDKIEKLEIAPPLPQAKLIDEHIPVALNPFFDDGINTNNSASCSKHSNPGTNSLVFSERPQRSRKGRLRRCSESIIDECKLQNSLLLSSDIDVLTSPRTNLKVNKIPMKKNSYCIDRKVLLRKPMLRTLQTCFNIRSTSKRKRLPASEHLTDCANSMSDFRDLIKECDNMVMNNINLNSNLNSVGFKHKNLKNLNNVTVSNIKKDNIFPYRSGAINNNIFSTASSPVSTEPITSLRSSTSCSQQAASHHSCSHSHTNSINASNTAGTTDDVTIDELASYFDTLVHIPKKMSSMAEMMYI